MSMKYRTQSPWIGSMWFKMLYNQSLKWFTEGSMWIKLFQVRHITYFNLPDVTNPIFLKFVLCTVLSCSLYLLYRKHGIHLDFSVPFQCTVVADIRRLKLVSARCLWRFWKGQLIIHILSVHGALSAQMCARFLSITCYDVLNICSISDKVWCSELGILRKLKHAPFIAVPVSLQKLYNGFFECLKSRSWIKANRALSKAERLLNQSQNINILCPQSISKLKLALYLSKDQTD